MPLKKTQSFLQQSLEKTFRFLLAQIHSARSTSSGVHGPRRAEKNQENAQEPSQTQPLGKVC